MQNAGLDLSYLLNHLHPKWVQNPKRIFQADSCSERDIIVGGSDTRFWL
jgi:hypothetical protein